MTIYFVAGEVSADNHGAALMRSLRGLDPELKFIGRGGPQMQRVADAQFKNWIDDAAVLGLWEVLRKYGYFREQFRQTLNEIQQSKPDAVVLIDYPGFNLRLARALRRQSQRHKTIYYISPQVWAWNRGRIKKMARFIESHRLAPYTERSADIGVVLDLMIHDLEVILHFVRSPLWSIDAVGVPVLSQSEDIANARLHFEDGCVANVTASRISPERMRKIRIFQEDAYLSLDYQNQSGEIYRRVGKQIWRDRAEIEHGEPLKLQLTSFIECASTGRQPRVSGSQATAALELAVKITKQISSSG